MVLGMHKKCAFDGPMHGTFATGRVQHDASMIVPDPDPASFYYVATLDAAYHPACTGELGNHLIGEQPCRWRRRGASSVTTMRGGATKAAMQVPVRGICTNHFPLSC